MSANAWIEEGARFASDSPVNAMTVDVEDYFRCPLSRRHRRERLGAHARARQKRTPRVLDLFGRHGVHATFFTLGWVAERFPALSRGASWLRVTKSRVTASITRGSFTRSRRSSARMSSAPRSCLEDVTGGAVNGYRAASYSIGVVNLWALDVPQKPGIATARASIPSDTISTACPMRRASHFRVRAGGLLGAADHERECARSALAAAAAADSSASFLCRCRVGPAARRQPERSPAPASSIFIPGKWTPTAAHRGHRTQDAPASLSQSRRAWRRVWSDCCAISHWDRMDRVFGGRANERCVQVKLPRKRRRAHGGTLS